MARTRGLPPPVSPETPRSSRLVAAGVGGACLAVYLATLCPGIHPGDSADLTTAAATLGIPHPPGYPTYTLLGWLFSRLSPSEPAWGVNFLSAVFGALAASLVCLAAAELAGSAWAGAVAGLVLGLAPRFWLYSVVAEVFTLNAFFAALLLWLAVRPPTPRRMAVVAGVFGLGLSHHHTLILIVPGLAMMIGRRGLSWSPRLLAGCAIAFAGGLSPYLYPLLRARSDPPLNWGDPETLAGLWRLVTRADYGTFSLLPEGARGAFGERPLWGQLAVYSHTMLEGTQLLCTLLAVGGAVWLVRRRPGAGRGLVLAWALSGPAFLLYARFPLEHPFWTGVVERFYLLPHVPLALIAGCALGPWPRIRAPLAGALVLLVAGSGLAHWEEVDHSANRVGEEFATNLLSEVPQGGLLLTSGDDAGMLLEYVRYVRGWRPDVVHLDQDKLTRRWYVESCRRRYPEVVIPWPAYQPARGRTLADLVAANYGTRPILIWRALDPSLGTRFRLIPVGLTLRVAEPGEAPSLEEVARRMEARWQHYRKTGLARSYSPRTFEYLITSYYGVPFHQVALLYRQAGQADRAEAWFRRAMEVAPHYELPYRELGRLLLEQGRSREGQRLLRRYLELAPDARDAEAMRSILRGSGDPVPASKSP